MGYYLGYALSLFGREQDRLSHVLVSPPYENHREFYYPTPYEHAIHVNEGGREVAYDCRYARVELADIPFVRLRQGLPRELLDGNVRFSDAVAAAQQSTPTPELCIDVRQRRVTAGGEVVKLSPKGFLLLLWLAQRRKQGHGPVTINSNRTADVGLERDFLALCREVFGRHSAETAHYEEHLQKGMQIDWFSPAKTRVNAALERALGRRGAAPYKIQTLGKRCEGRFGITLDPRCIHIR